MAEAERAIDPEGVLSFTEAVGELIDVCMSFNRKRPEFHNLVVDAPLSPSAREDKQVLGQASSTSSRPASGASYPLSRAPKRPTMGM